VIRIALAFGLVASLTVGNSPATATSSLQGDLTVSAAASLTESFTKIARQFRRVHPQVRVRLNFASTSSLVSQIQSGAPVDVFASADLASQDRLAASGNITSTPRVFSRNAMQIAVKPGNPLAIKGVSDLARVGVIGLCSRTAPCGVYAASVMALNKTVVPESQITRGADAKATLASVSVGDANAAIVYVTDVRSAGAAVSGVVIPPNQNVRAIYGVSVIRGSDNRAAAQAFVDYLLGRDAQAVLKSFGFLAP
jgi:molybdate transport system substrate-binding protein